MENNEHNSEKKKKKKDHPLAEKIVNITIALIIFGLTIYFFIKALKEKNYRKAFEIGGSWALCIFFLLLMNEKFSNKVDETHRKIVKSKDLSFGLGILGFIIYILVTAFILRN